jgi:gamma-glutamyltranspeptidase/glutathione hydrolase
VPAWHLGRITAAGVRPDGMLHAAADPRGMECWAAGR